MKAIDERDAKICRLAAFLLRYPDEPWQATVRALAEHGVQKMLPRREAERVTPMLRHACELAPADLQVRYSDLFDFNAETTLNVTAIVFGEEKDRGKRPQRGFGLVQLAEAYHRAGFEMADGELPDHLPAILEFLAEAGCPDGFERYLNVLHPAIVALAERLVERNSPYAGVVAVAGDAAARIAKAAGRTGHARNRPQRADTTGSASS